LQETHSPKGISEASKGAIGFLSRIAVSKSILAASKKAFQAQSSGKTWRLLSVQIYFTERSLTGK
jgi:hypothetical protein